VFNAFVLPAVSIAGIATILAVIILVAERYLMDYGDVDMTINDDKKFTVKGGNTLLNTLKEQKIFIPSACGGRATCAYCKVKAVSGFGELLPTEAPLLTKEEIDDNVRLSCQLKVKQDVSIEIPEELFSIKEYQTKLEDVMDLTYDIKQFQFKLLEPEAIEYKAGQYVQFQNEPYGDVADSFYRAYSMCGCPKDSDCIDLMVRLVPDGTVTTYMFHHMKEGDNATITGPFGDFYLRDTDRKMICIAGGSGMAPIRSILLDMTKEEIEKREPVFFFGARAKKDLFMLEEWAQFEKENPKFRFVPALSQPDPDDNWEGELGRITDVVERYFDNLSDYEGYLCGSPGLLDACVSVLTDLGLPEERIYFDKFE
jgi:Na+-transporting NADH:ubiquinone oxidoreductase subunit F